MSNLVTLYLCMDKNYKTTKFHNHWAKWKDLVMPSEGGE
jgi:hypothetical protein